MLMQPTRMALKGEHQQHNTAIDEEIDEFVDAWIEVNKDNWKQNVQLGILALMFSCFLGVVGYICYQVYQFNVLQVIQSLQR